MQDEDHLYDEEIASTGYELLLKKDAETKALQGSSVRFFPLSIPVIISIATLIILVIIVSDISASLDFLAPQSHCELFLMNS